jgi:putative tricarboxylic transport membrane protein
MKKLFIIVLALAMVFTTVACGSSAPAADDQSKAETYPTKDISLIIQSSPGGGSDLFARTFASAVTENKLLNVNVTPENMPGGSGAVAYAYVADKAGDPYYLLNASGTFITTPVLGTGTDAGNINYEDFSCVAALALDEMVVVVPADSPYQSVTDLVNAAKEKVLNSGGTEMGGPDSICYFLLEKNTGSKFNYITFDGADEMNAALLGKNIEVAIGNPGDFLELIKGGKLRALGTFSEERLACLPDVPTCIEQGYDVSYALTRGFVLPKDVPEEAVTVLENTIQAYMKTDAWKNYVEANSLTEKYMNHEEFYNFCKESTEMHTQILKEMGLISQ